MTDLQNELVQRLKTIPEVDVSFYKESELLCVYYKEKDVAHFQNPQEIDIRLSRSIIKREGLTPPEDSSSHPDRSKNSIWIVQAFNDEEDVDEMVRLVKLAIGCVVA